MKAPKGREDLGLKTSLRFSPARGPIEDICTIDGRVVLLYHLCLYAHVLGRSISHVPEHVRLICKQKWMAPKLKRSKPKVINNLFSDLLKLLTGLFCGNCAKLGRATTLKKAPADSSGNYFFPDMRNRKSKLII